MGSACCVAARDKSVISNGPHSDVLHRNVRYSPTWSFRWENRGRVAGEETSLSWFSGGISHNNDGSEIKYESAFTSENGSPLGSFQRGAWQKSPISEGTAGHLRTPTSDRSISRNVSLDVSLEEGKESARSSIAPSYPSPAKSSLSLPSSSPVPNTSKSDSRVSGVKSSNCSAIKEERPETPSLNNESTKGSYGGSSDGWSMNTFSELMATSHRERWSFDSESTFGFNRERLSQFSGSPCVDHIQTCGVCLKPLTEKSLWSSQKIISCDELSVVAVLTCGHVYHSECLENMTSEVYKYDPACPVCTFGVKQARKLSEKALKAGMELKAKNMKKSRSQIVYSDFDSESFRFKDTANELKGPKMGPSSSSKGSLGKPFLRRHFTFSSKGSKPISDNCPTKKKGFFWTKSSK